jgi:hypothetical protein
MAFTLTKYIYPLKDKITLSQHLRYEIDNPRTEEEILFVKEYISYALQRHYENSKPDYNPMLSAAFAISEWRNYMKGKDEYVHNYFASNLKTSVEDIISQSWIILRYEDNGEFEMAKKDRGVFFDIFFSDKKHTYWEKYNNLQSYCQIISLLSHDDEDRYIGDSFVSLRKPQDIFYPVDHTHEIIEAFTTFHGNCSIGSDSRGKTWNFFPDVKDNLISACGLIEIMLKRKGESDSTKRKQSSEEKILFAGDLLRVIENETHDVKVKLLLLVSIIEFMLIRNPDSNRFNVEDSISKQFILKATLLVYNVHQDIDLKETKEALKIIYNQRSDVAHGNFISKSDNEKIIQSFYLLYKYIRAIVSEYIRDPKFVEFIKEN